MAMNINAKARKRALLLHLAGERVHDIYDTLAEEKDDYEDTKTKLHGYFTPKKHTVQIQKSHATSRGDPRHLPNQTLHLSQRLNLQISIARSRHN